MAKGGPYSLKHVVILVLLAVVLNAQFSWWVAYSLRENGVRLQLERQLMRQELVAAGAKLSLRLDQLELERPSAGSIPTLRAPFSAVLLFPQAQQERGWVFRSRQLALVVPVGRGLSAHLVLPLETLHRWVEEQAPGSVLLTPEDSPLKDREVVKLPPPLEGFALAPDRQRWQESLLRYQRRVLMVVTEGVFFWLGMAVVVALLWRMLRQEASLEEQRQNFISAVTHELKTPLAGIRLALETVLSGRASGESQGRFLSNALADVERLESLVEKVLEVTRFASGAHRLHIRLGDLSQLVEEEVMVAERRAAARGVRLETHISAGVQAPFDSEALSIALSNLLENALKYASPQDPWVRVQLSVEQGQAVVEVSDNGVGIAAEDLPKIFAVFYRGRAGTQAPGTGIGLFVAQQIMRAHGGTLTASSPGPGMGATFRLTLPGAVVEEENSE